MATKILLDTDIGSDIDDAVCLVYLLAQPECNLLGVTTVSGQAAERAKLASALCRVAERDVPIFVGADDPLLTPQLQPEVPQATALGTWPHEVDFPGEHAVEFMRRTIRSNPGEVVLLTIGPLTNVALLFAIDPEIPGLLKGLVSMAGSYWKRVHDGCEWNVMCDPHAAAVVYRARPPYHRSVGLDVTMQVTMDAAAVRRRFETKLLRPVLDMAEVWFGGRELMTFHDPLAAAVVFDDEICGFDRGCVTVEVQELDDRQRLGVTHWSTDGAAPGHEVATTVDPAAFLDHYFAVVSSTPDGS